MFPAGFPHSIQGLQPNGCEFLLVFDQGDFSEDGTFLLSETTARAAQDLSEEFWSRTPKHCTRPSAARRRARKLYLNE